MQEIYRPLLRYYFACFALYYGLILPTHFDSYSGVGQMQMITLAASALSIALSGVFLFRRSMHLLAAEILVLLLNVLVVANILVALQLNFSSVKLVYFVIIAMAFSLFNVSLRQSLASIGIASFAYISFMPSLDTETFVIFGFLSVGAAIASLAIAFMLRRAITLVAKAKIEAEDQLGVARELEQTFRQQSLSDELTGLPNRRAFFGLFDDIANSQSDGSNVWLLLLDLDGFKAVNDVHGHFTGDKLLQEVANRVSVHARSDMRVCRMGGDEFNFILSTDQGAECVRMRCEALLKEIAAPYYIDDRQIRISASIGFRLIENTGCPNDQLTQADYALIVAKKRGKNCAVEFTDELAKSADERTAIESALRQADLNSELDMVFQPQFDFSASRVVAAEALVRWNSPIVGSIPPERFIRIAEESGLITGITMTVVEKTFRITRSWPGWLSLSINLSSHDLISDPNIDQIIELSERFNMDPAMIEFEVTETAMMADFDKATANLRRLSEFGFGIALDDFGTGYSNFNYLRRLPIDKLKVDRSFIENPADPMTERMLASLAGMARLLASLAGMARLLGVHCLLEGVEDEIGLLMAKRVGAQSAQGYLFGAPMTEQELLLLIANPASEERDLGAVGA